MSTLFNHAMRYEWTDRNPMRLARQSAKRLRTPDVLTAEEIGKLLVKLDGVYHVMTFLAAVTGLRVSELLALKWEDMDCEVGEINLTRAIVCQRRLVEDSSITETRSDGRWSCSAAAGLARKVSLQSRHGLCFRIR
jgi:integrase